MFYYLLYNSSFIKKKDNKDKTLYTLIYGSIIYIVLHAILSFSFKMDVVRYFWFIFLIDCAAMFISSDFEGFSSLNIVNYNKEEPIIERNNLIQEYINKNSKEESKKPVKKQKLEKKEPKKTKKKIVDSQYKKKVSFKESTPISILKKNQVEESYDEEEATNINLTLENLENLELEEVETRTGSQSISDLQNKFLKKKMEDEYSDPGSGSDIDLEGFEDSIMSG